MQVCKVVSAVWLAAALPLLTGCDQLGLETPAKTAERQLAEAKAIGGACRHAMRAIEDCYTLNLKADKSSVFAGWREMDEYMRENKLDGIAPTVPRPPGAGASKSRSRDADEEEAEPEEEEDTPSRSRTAKGQPPEEVIEDGPPKAATATTASNAKPGKAAPDLDRGKNLPPESPRSSGAAASAAPSR